MIIARGFLMRDIVAIARDCSDMETVQRYRMTRKLSTNKKILFFNILLKTLSDCFFRLIRRVLTILLTPI